MCQTEHTPLGVASKKGLCPKMQNHRLGRWIFIYNLLAIKLINRFIDENIIEIIKTLVKSKLYLSIFI